MKVRPVAANDRSEWIRMRTQLWPEEPDEHPTEVDQFYSKANEPQAVFVVEEERGKLSGFLEASARTMAEGCSSSPVGYIEGWWVAPGLRGTGRGAALVKAAEAWARSLGMTEMASDTETANELSQKAHEALGYVELARIVIFRKALNEAE